LNVLRTVKQTLPVVIFLLALAHPVPDLDPVPRLAVIPHGSYVIGWKEDGVAVD
jgi:hypothetical protein